MLAKNSEWAALVSLTDRRYFVLDVSNSRKNNHNLFKQLINEQNNDGKEALLQALMDYDLSEFEVRSMP
jgi:CDP-diacylglycerol pyrophosphatase